MKFIGLNLTSTSSETTQQPQQQPQSPTHPMPHVPPGTPAPLDPPTPPLTQSDSTASSKNDCDSLHILLSPPAPGPAQSQPQLQGDHDSAPILPQHARNNLNTTIHPSKLQPLLNPFHISLVLQNQGSVARDHLALERTYLAYVRTSLAIASVGVALVQLFSVSESDLAPKGSQLARPLGSAMVVYSLVVLVIGTFRYFRIQHTLPQGVFPTSLHGIALLAFILTAFITVLFALLIAGKT